MGLIFLVEKYFGKDLFIISRVLTCIIGESGKSPRNCPESNNNKHVTYFMKFEPREIKSKIRNQRY